MRARRVAGILLVSWVAAACPKRAEDPESRLAALLRESDGAWARRGDVGFDRAAEPLVLAYAMAPTDPRVAWRVARWRVAEGIVAADPGEARTAFAEARSAAAACIDAEPGFAERASANGWSAALRDLPPDRLPCAAWTALAWVRWVEVHGADAAALDFEPIDALTVRARDDGDLAVRAVVAWADGLSRQIRPVSLGRDPAAAEDALREAAALQPDSVAVRADLWRLVVGPSGTAGDRASLASDIAGVVARGNLGPEDAAAVARIEADLAAALPPSR